MGNHLNSPAHATHCIRCLRGLPGAYTEADTQRQALANPGVAIAFYCLGSLDILGLLESKVSAAEREDWRAWLWEQQIDSEYGSTSGFRPSPHLDTTISDGLNENPYDVPHVIITYTALLALAILRDDFSKLNRSGIINLLKQCQGPDGSVYTYPSDDQGEADVRAVYCAVVISYMLDDWSGIESDKILSFIRRCRTFEGGYGTRPSSEAQGGSTYCALASLHLLQSRDLSSARLTAKEIKQTVRWLNQSQTYDGGFRGRTNKDADACYSFWCGASLQILGFETHVAREENTCFLSMSQSRYGGIAKSPGEDADPMHTYLSLAALAIYPVDGFCNEDGNLAHLDSVVNATAETSKWIKEHIPVRNGNSLEHSHP